MKTHWFPLIKAGYKNPYESQGGTLGRGRLTSLTDGLEKSGEKNRSKAAWRIGPQDLDTWFITMVIAPPPLQILNLTLGHLGAFPYNNHHLG